MTNNLNRPVGRGTHSVMRTQTAAWRWWFMLIASVAFMATLLARLVDVQLWRGSSFRVAAEQNRIHQLPIPAERGLILDRYNQPVVWNSRRYYQVSDPKVLYPDTVPISRNDALVMMATTSGEIVSDWVREYRWPESLSHVVGYVGKATAEELEQGTATGVSDQVGKMGLELLLHRQLRGMDGRNEFEVNALGQRQKVIAVEPAQEGETVPTTLDPYLSEVAYRALGGLQGNVIILNAETGDVLAMVSSPAFNANMLAQPAMDTAGEVRRRQELERVFSDARQVFFNRAISGNYPPGSTFKLLTALAGLETNAITPDTIVVDEGVLKVGEYEYRNWFYRQFGRTDGPVSVVKAIARSNDIYFYKAAEFIGPERLAEMARLFGLGSKTEIGLPGEASGLVPDPEWKQRTLGEKWFLGNTYHYGIGQGDLLVTPIQMAQVVQTLANNGLRCKPHLLSKERAVCTQVTMNDQSWEVVLRGMLDACSNGGTAYPFFPYNQTRRQESATVKEDIMRGAIACKTGTAEFGAQNEQGFRRTHGWFVGMAHIEIPGVTSVATESASATVSAQPLRRQVITADVPVPREEWIQLLQEAPLPSKLVFVALVESDDQKLYREGSQDAAPVIKKIIDWMEGTLLL